MLGSSTDSYALDSLNFLPQELHKASLGQLERPTLGSGGECWFLRDLGQACLPTVALAYSRPLLFL